LDSTDATPTETIAGKVPDVYLYIREVELQTPCLEGVA
jgi:hypothetical protein